METEAGMEELGGAQSGVKRPLGVDCTGSEENHQKRAAHSSSGEPSAAAVAAAANVAREGSENGTGAIS